ncbi:MAG TPA: TlpA disulfide reductase family protein [Bryobacteraceae bacterium]|jgi:peroxiredoxin
MKTKYVLLLLATSLLFGAGELSHRRAPGFSIRDAAGDDHDLADYRGKYVIVDFMQTGCTHCIAFGETIEKLMIKYRPKLAALSIVVPPDNLNTVAAYIKAHNITIPVLYDCGQVTASYLKVGPRNPHVVFPDVFIVDPQGNIINNWIYGPGTESIFEGDGFTKEIAKLLGGAK